MHVSKTQLALAGIGVAAVVAATTAGTMALFTDTKSVDANAFSTGTISLTTSPTTALVTFSNMMPGDMVTNPLVVTNTGQNMRYSVSSTATNADTKGLKDQLVLTVKTKDIDTAACTNFNGTQLYTGDLDSTAGKILGDVTPGNQTGDHTLAAGANETLCLQVSLPIGTGAGFKSTSTTATFQFDAEQTANNP